jgi:hypothetical protein
MYTDDLFSYEQEILDESDGEGWMHCTCWLDAWTCEADVWSQTWPGGRECLGRSCWRMMLCTCSWAFPMLLYVDKNKYRNSTTEETTPILFMFLVSYDDFFLFRRILLILLMLVVSCEVFLAFWTICRIGKCLQLFFSIILFTL